MAVLKRTSCRLLIALTAGLASTLSVLAQAEDVPSDLTELSLEKLMDMEVVTAARHTQKVGDSPASVTVITAGDIDEFGYRTLAEALRSVTGLYLSNDRNYTSLGVRGFAIPGDYSNRVLLLIDGYRVNDPTYHQLMIDHTFPVPIEAVKRIEIVRGPGSALYGGNALLAVINVLTKDGADLKGPGARGNGALKGEGGANSATRTVLAYGNTFQNQADLITSGLFYRTDGDAVVTSPGRAEIRHADKEQASMGFAKLRYKDLTLSIAGSQRLKDIPTASFSTTEGPGSKTTDEYLFSHLRYDHAIDATKSLSAQTSYNSYNYTGQYLIVTPPSSTDNRDLLKSSWSRTELQFQWDVTTWNKLTLGGSYERALDVKQRTFNVGTPGDILNINRPTWSWGAFLQEEISLGPRVDLVLGAGLDEYRDSGHTLNYRAAALYRPAQGTTVKLLYGTASRAPTLYELFYTDGLTLLANPHLKIERITTYEAAIAQALPGGIEGTLSAFQYRFKDLLSQVDMGGGRFQFRNVGRSMAQGLELSLHKRWGSGAVVRLGGVVQNAKDVNGERRANSPRSIVNLGIVAPLLSHKTTLAVDTQYLGDRRTIRGRETGESFVTTAHLRFRDVFGLRQWDCSATVTNLFNERAFVPGGNEHQQDVIPGPSRAFLVGLQYTF